MQEYFGRRYRAVQSGINERKAQEISVIMFSITSLLKLTASVHALLIITK